MLTPATGLTTLLGAGVGLGLVLIVRGFTSSPPVRRRWWVRPSRQAGAGALAAVLVGVGTRWPVAAVLTGLAVWLLPALFGHDRAHRSTVTRIEAVATWAERLRDTLAAAAGIEQAIHATAGAAPAAIRTEVSALAARLTAGERIGTALRRFGDDLADPTADLVVAALVLAVEQQARHLGELLGALAAAARAQAQLRLRVSAARARTRTSVRVILATTLAMAAGLVVLNRGYLAPYDTVAGQLVLTVVGVLFAVAMGWLARIARMEPLARLLARDPR